MILDPEQVVSLARYLSSKHNIPAGHFGVTINEWRKSATATRQHEANIERQFAIILAPILTKVIDEYTKPFSDDSLKELEFDILSRLPDPYQPWNVRITLARTISFSIALEDASILIDNRWRSINYLFVAKD